MAEPQGVLPYVNWPPAALIEIAVELYPREAEFCDTMAEIHMRKGKRLYKKALEVDPGFEHAWEMLKKLK